MNWIKSNPVTVISILVMVLAGASFFWPTRSGSKAFKLDLEKSAGKMNDLNRIKTFRAEIPPERPDDDPTDVRLVVNPAAIERVGQIYDVIGAQYTSVFDRLVQFNRRDDRLMHPGLFPRPTSLSAVSDARLEHAEHYLQLCRLLRAGRPVPKKEMEDTVRRVSEDHASRAAAAGDRSSGGNSRALDREKRNALMKLLQRRANGVQIYASEPVPNPDDSRKLVLTSTSFTIGEWVNGKQKPTMFELWEAQMMLWIQQDIVKAIAEINHADDPTRNVTDSPVKRIMRTSTRPGIYIRILNRGGYVGINPDSGHDAEEPERGGRSRTAAVGPRNTSDFTYTFTGRQSNDLYDVINVDLNLVVDSERIPEVIEALTSVNFVTVLQVNVTDVDEVKHMADGYFYGDRNVVQLSLVLETIWLRRWTAGHDSRDEARNLGETFSPGVMPDRVRYMLGLTPRDPDYEGRSDDLRSDTRDAAGPRRLR